MNDTYVWFVEVNGAITQNYLSWDDARAAAEEIGDSLMGTLGLGAYSQTWHYAPAIERWQLSFSGTHQFYYCLSPVAVTRYLVPLARGRRG